MRKITEPTPNVILAAFPASNLRYFFQQLSALKGSVIEFGLLYLFFLFGISIWMGLEKTETHIVLISQLLKSPLYLAVVGVCLFFVRIVYELVWGRKSIRLDGNVNALFIGRQQIGTLDNIRCLQVRVVQDRREDGSDRYLFSLFLEDGRRFTLGIVSSYAAFEKWVKRLTVVTQYDVLIERGEKQ